MSNHDVSSHRGRCKTEPLPGPRRLIRLFPLLLLLAAAPLPSDAGDAPEASQVWRMPVSSLLELASASQRAALEHPARVEVIRLASEDIPGLEPGNGYRTRRAHRGEENVDGFAVAYRGKDLAPPALREAERLLAVVAYTTGYGTKLCGGFQPKVTFRFWSEAPAGGAPRHVDVSLCFNCDDVVLSCGNSRGPSALADIQPLRADWLRLVRRALPDDVQFALTKLVGH
jgi:hypothetical protein